jgi:hypothetical protein
MSRLPFHGVDVLDLGPRASPHLLLMYTRTPYAHVLYMPFEHTSYTHMVHSQVLCEFAPCAVHIAIHGLRSIYLSKVPRDMP